MELVQLYQTTISARTQGYAFRFLTLPSKSLTGAIQKALEERLERLKHQRRSQVLTSQLEDILRRVDQLPILDSRTADEILDYDENGLPR